MFITYYSFGYYENEIGTKFSPLNSE